MDTEILKNNENWKLPARRSLGAGGEIGNSRRRRAGFSLIEMLVVLFVFSILGIVSTQILALSLRGSKKSESIGEVRSNVEYAASTMERLLRNAKSITTCNGTTLEYVDEFGNVGLFECDTGIIASGSGALVSNLTSDRVSITCSGIFACVYPLNLPPSISITLVGEDANLGTGAEGSSVTVMTQLQLRTYGEY